MSRLSYLDAQVHSNASATQPLFVRYITPSATATLPAQAVGTTDRLSVSTCRPAC